MNLLSHSIKALFETPKCSIGGTSLSIKATRTLSFYQYSNTKTKFLLLDVFAHTPFVNLPAATKSVFSSLSSSSVSVEEQKYFLRIAFERSVFEAYLFINEDLFLDFQDLSNFISRLFITVSDECN